MSFEDAEESCKRLRELMAHTTGRDLIEEVSLERPGGKDAKARFATSVLWAYAFWFEACQPVGNALKTMVRGVAPEDFKRVNDASAAIQHLRTVQAHNLVASRKSDAFHQEQAAIWLLEHGGDPPDWNPCFEAICQLLIEISEILIIHWTRIIFSEADAETARVKLLASIDRELPPHCCDNILNFEAKTLKLNGFDIVAFRKLRLESWRSYYRMFEVAEDGCAALRRVIRADLKATFGIYEDEK